MEALLWGSEYFALKNNDLLRKENTVSAYEIGSNGISVAGVIGGIIRCVRMDEKFALMAMRCGCWVGTERGCYIQKFRKRKGPGQSVDAIRIVCCQFSRTIAIILIMALTIHYQSEPIRLIPFKIFPLR